MTGLKSTLYLQDENCSVETADTAPETLHTTPRLTLRVATPYKNVCVDLTRTEATLLARQLLAWAK